jgi:hypothetical protein
MTQLGPAFGRLDSHGLGQIIERQRPTDLDRRRRRRRAAMNMILLATRTPVADLRSRQLHRVPDSPVPDALRSRFDGIGIRKDHCDETKPGDVTEERAGASQDPRPENRQEDRRDSDRRQEELVAPTLLGKDCPGTQESEHAFWPQETRTGT